VIDEVNHSGAYTWPGNNAIFPRIQVITIEQLLKGERPKTPPLLPAYIPAAKTPNTDWVQDTIE
jgi:hypothetical protein